MSHRVYLVMHRVRDVSPAENDEFGESVQTLLWKFSVEWLHHAYMRRSRRDFVVYRILTVLTENTSSD